MQYFNIRSRAGLVVLVFALIISLVSAVPIPATESGLSSTASPSSNPSLNGQDYIQLDTPRIPKIPFSGRMSTLPAATRVLTRSQHISTTNMDDQLVRRNVFDNIKHAFQKFGSAVKSGFQKAGSAIKKGFQKVGGAIKSGFQKAGSAIKKGFQKVGGAFKKAGSAIKKGFQKVGGAFKKAGSAIKKGFQKAGGAIKKGFQKVGGAFKKAGSAIKKGFQKVGQGIKNVAQKVGHGIKIAAQKVGHFMKTTGAKIAKFGLKVVESVGTVVGKIAGFIPAIGKPIDRAIEGVSKIAGVISDHIHVKLPGNLEKGMDVMNKADQIMGYIPRRRDLSEEEESFQHRDISEPYYLEERDDFALEDRDESYFEAIERDIYERYDLDY